MQIAKTWRQQSANLRLIGSRCRTCGTHIFPERLRCSNCSGDDVESCRFGGLGEVLAFTTVHEAPRGFGDQVPYVTGLVRLDEGPVIVAMLADILPERPQVGMRVEMVTRKIWADGSEGPIVYGYKFIPVD
jgi:uncharacterized OB-fold protein